MKKKEEYTAPVLKKGKKWYIEYYQYNPATGEMDRKRDYNGLNGKKIPPRERAAIASDKQKAIGKWLETTAERSERKVNKPISLIIEDFIAIKKATLRPKSLTHYTQGKRVFLEFGYGNLKPELFTPVLAQKYSDFLITEKGYSGKSHNNQIQYASTLFNMMIDREMISKNPFKKVKMQPVDMGKNIAFSDKQRKEIREYLERNNHPLYPLVQFIYYCFIRPNELMQLQIKHIDFDTNAINIPAHISKNRKQASVEMPKAFAQLVRNKYKEVDPEFYICGRGLVPHPVPVHRNRLTHAHKLVLEDLGISNVHTLYCHKHTGAVAAMKAGVNPYDLMRQLRHSSLEQTMIYLKTLGLVPNTGYSSKQTTF